jgi:hypothetical protein
MSLASASHKITESTSQFLGNATGSQFKVAIDQLWNCEWIYYYGRHIHIIHAPSFTLTRQSEWRIMQWLQTHALLSECGPHRATRVGWAWRIPALSCPRTLAILFGCWGHLCASHATFRPRGKRLWKGEISKCHPLTSSLLSASI